MDRFISQIIIASGGELNPPTQSHHQLHIYIRKMKSNDIFKQLEHGMRIILQQTIALFFKQT